MKLRGRDEVLTTEGACRSEGSGLECIVECDGGGVRIEPRGDHVMMHLDRIRMITCDQNLLDDGEEVRGGKDDRVFRLNRIAGDRPNTITTQLWDEDWQSARNDDRRSATRRPSTMSAARRSDRSKMDQRERRSTTTRAASGGTE